jgi:hypothetical protein
MVGCSTTQMFDWKFVSRPNNRLKANCHLHPCPRKIWKLMRKLCTTIHVVYKVEEFLFSFGYKLCNEKGKKMTFSWLLDVTYFSSIWTAHMRQFLWTVLNQTKIVIKCVPPRILPMAIYRAKSWVKCQESVYVVWGLLHMEVRHYPNTKFHHKKILQVTHTTTIIGQKAIRCIGCFSC